MGLTDASGTMFLSVFDRHYEELLKISANEYKDMYDRKDAEGIKEIHKRVVGKTVSGIARIKNDE